MEINWNTYSELATWVMTTKEGMAVIALVIYFACFFIPAVKVSFFDSEGEKTGLLTSIIVFIVTFVLLPPVLLLALVLDFLGFLSVEVEWDYEN